MHNIGSQRLVIIGAGEHASVVVEAILAAGLGDIVGLIDPAPSRPKVANFSVLGGDEVLSSLIAEGPIGAVVALGNNALRQRVGYKLRELGFALPAVVHPSALISPSALVHDGAVVLARAVVGTEAIIKEFAIINTSASVDHGNVIGVAAHVAPGCALAGNVSVGDRTLVGVGSAVCPGVQIGADVIVGAGSAVISAVPDGAKVGGVPARPLISKK